MRSRGVAAPQSLKMFGNFNYKRSTALLRRQLAPSSNWWTVVQVFLLIVNLQVLVWTAIKREGVSGAPTSPASPTSPVAHSRIQLTGHEEKAYDVQIRDEGFESPQISDRVTDPTKSFPLEIWARPKSSMSDPEVVATRQLLKDEEISQLREMCGRTLYHGLENIVVSHQTGLWTFFATGDLPLMWLRDSAFQIGVLLPRLRQRPILRRVVEGAIRAQAFYILQDPYANGFYPEWRHPQEHNTYDRRLGRGGWVGVRNYELDSGAYFMNLLWNYYRTDGIYRPEVLLSEPLIYDAAMTMVRLWVNEQTHNESSPYRFSELSNNGLGPPVGFTGMTWSGFRPSDDANTYGYSIPSNMYAASALQKALVINSQVWHSEEFRIVASKLLRDIDDGLMKFGRVKINQSETIYAYEVDGLGNSLEDFDDPNWPSLVSMPLLGYADGFDPSIYRATRSRLLSTVNKYWYIGTDFEGMGSPHTSNGMAWALGTLSEVLTADTAEEKAAKLKLLLKLQCGDGLMHESIHVNDPKRCTRRWFEWANALAVTAVEQVLGEDCEAAAQKLHLEQVSAREQSEGAGADYDARRHQPIEAMVQWDVKYDEKVESWKGIGNLI